MERSYGFPSNYFQNKYLLGGFPFSLRPFWNYLSKIHLFVVWVEYFSSWRHFLTDPIAISSYKVDSNMYISTLLLENSPNNVQKYEPVLRFLIDPIPITIRHLLFRCLILHVAINFIARKFTKKCAKIWVCIKIFNWPNTYHIKALIV